MGRSRSRLWACSTWQDSVPQGYWSEALSASLAGGLGPSLVLCHVEPLHRAALSQVLVSLRVVQQETAREHNGTQSNLRNDVLLFLHILFFTSSRSRGGGYT